MEGSGSGSNRGEEAKTWDEMYSIDLMPSELFLKFREQIHGYRLGLNLEVHSFANLYVDLGLLLCSCQLVKPYSVSPYLGNSAPVRITFCCWYNNVLKL